MNLELARALCVQLTEALAPDPPVAEPLLVTNGADLQVAVNNALPGDVIELLPERYAVGTLYLPAKNGPVRITTRGILAQTRTQPDMQFATLASGSLAPAIDGTNAANWILDGLSLESRSDGLGDIIVLFDAANITMDRLLIVAGSAGQKRAIRGNGTNITLTRSHIANIWRTGQDSQAFAAWDGAGPYTIVDNYTEAAGENIMFGGADSQSPERVPADILIEDNTITKNLAWKGVANTYAVKNLLEFKSAKRFIVRNNVFTNNWTDAQNGYAILIKSVNQNNTAPWSASEDGEIYDNTISGVENGFNILGSDTLTPAGTTTRIHIYDNTVTTDRTAVQLGGKAGIISITDNAFHQGGNLLTLYGIYAAENLTYTGNTYRDVPYGIKGDGTASGLPSLTKYCQTFTYSGNVIG